MLNRQKSFFWNIGHNRREFREVIVYFRTTAMKNTSCISLVLQNKQNIPSCGRLKQCVSPLRHIFSSISFQMSMLCWTQRTQSRFFQAVKGPFYGCGILLYLYHYMPLLTCCYSNHSHQNQFLFYVSRFFVAYAWPS